MELMRLDIESAARTSAKVLITGETGVGKEVVARLIHEQGARSRQAFVAVNCSGIQSCDGNVSGNAPNVHVYCNGRGSCRDDVTCNASSCEVRCNGQNSCQGNVQCNSGNPSGDC